MDTKEIVFVAMLIPLFLYAQKMFLKTYNKEQGRLMKFSNRCMDVLPI
ncbi:MAG: hypothetical protein IJ778_03465 [Alphaproteobacteria bacterium]|nr:hypothetical protein [Alphaproteobacteria bacterium]